MREQVIISKFSLDGPQTGKNFELLSFQATENTDAFRMKTQNYFQKHLKDQKDQKQLF
jgi:hypothetical protein